MGLTCVVGCGRSGTNLLGRILGTHPYMTAKIEDVITFDAVASAAHYGLHIPHEVTSKYMEWVKKHENVVVKDHPLFFCADANYRPYQYIYIYRNPISVVASTLRHEGCLRQLKRPPGHLNGANLVSNYYDLPMYLRATYRWINAMEHWKREYARLGYAIKYEDLIAHPEGAMGEVAEWMGVDNLFYYSMVRQDAKGGEGLTREQKYDIYNIVREYVEWVW